MTFVRADFVALELGEEGWGVCRLNKDTSWVEYYQALDLNVKPYGLGVLHHRQGRDLLVMLKDGAHLGVNHYEWSKAHSKFELRMRSRIDRPDKSYRIIGAYVGNPLGRSQEQIYALWSNEASLYMTIDSFDIDERWQRNYKFEITTSRGDVDHDIVTFEVLKPQKDLLCKLKSGRGTEQYINVRRKRIEENVSQFEAVKQRWAWDVKGDREWRINWCTRLDSSDIPWRKYPQEGESFALQLNIKNEDINRGLGDISKLSLSVYKSHDLGREWLGKQVLDTSFHRPKDHDSMNIKLDGPAFKFFKKDHYLFVLSDAESGQEQCVYRVSLTSRPVWLKNRYSADVHEQKKNWEISLWKALGSPQAINIEGLLQQEFPKVDEGYDRQYQASEGDLSHLIYDDQFELTQELTHGNSLKGFLNVWNHDQDKSFFFGGGRPFDLQEKNPSSFLKTIWNPWLGYGWPKLSKISIIPQMEVIIRVTGLDGLRCKNLNFELLSEDGQPLGAEIFEGNDQYRWKNLPELWSVISKNENIYLRCYHAGQKWTLDLLAQEGLSLREGVVEAIMSRKKMFILNVELPWMDSDVVKTDGLLLEQKDGQMLYLLPKSSSEIQWYKKSGRRWEPRSGVISGVPFSTEEQWLPLPTNFEKGKSWVCRHKNQDGFYHSEWVYIPKDNMLSFAPFNNGYLCLGQTEKGIGFHFWRKGRWQGRYDVDPIGKCAAPFIKTNHFQNQILMGYHRNGLGAMRTYTKTGEGQWVEGEVYAFDKIELSRGGDGFDAMGNDSWIAITDEGRRLRLMDSKMLSIAKWQRKGLHAVALIPHPSNKNVKYVLDQRKGRFWIHAIHLDIKKNEIRNTNFSSPELRASGSYLSPVPMDLKSNMRVCIDNDEFLWLTDPSTRTLKVWDLNGGQWLREDLLEIEGVSAVPILAEGNKVMMLQSSHLRTLKK